MAAHSPEMLEQSRYTVLGGNRANKGNMATWPLRNGVICMTTDGIPGC